MRKFLVTMIAALTLGVLATPAAVVADSSDSTVHIGALLSITGGGSTLGNTSKAALQVAVKKWNALPASKRGDTKLVLDVYNTNLEPEKALTGLKALAKKGAKIVIGPQSSSEVAAIKDEAMSLGVLVVSQGSTASSLAIPDDNVFRFVPTDHVEGKAITDLMVKDGATQIVPMWRNDAGNQGLSDTVRSTGPTEGATVSEGFRYEADTTDFTDGLAAITTQVNDAIATAGVDHVAVYLAGFEETADVLAAAKAIPDLANVRWYGGDGSAQATALDREQGRRRVRRRRARLPEPARRAPRRPRHQGRGAHQADQQAGQGTGRRVHARGVRRVERRRHHARHCGPGCRRRRAA